MSGYYGNDGAFYLYSGSNKPHCTNCGNGNSQPTVSVSLYGQNSSYDPYAYSSAVNPSGNGYYQPGNRANPQNGGYGKIYSSGTPTVFKVGSYGYGGNYWN